MQDAKMGGHQKAEEERQWPRAFMSYGAFAPIA
jgi:hypothetical protein